MASQSSPRSYARPRPPSKAALEVEALLSRYPHLHDRELEGLIRAFRRLPILDYALMRGDERLSAKVEAFERDHKSRLRSPAALIAFLSLPVAVAAGVVWAVLA